MLNVPRLLFYAHPFVSLYIYIYPDLLFQLGFELDIQKANCCEAKNTCVRNGYQLVVNQREVPTGVVYFFFFFAQVTPLTVSSSKRRKAQEFQFAMNNAIQGMIGLLRWNTIQCSRGLFTVSIGPFLLLFVPSESI
jgi:hypothetical protein